MQTGLIRAAKMVLSGALAFQLAGCWHSTTPLMPEAAKVAPAELKTQYVEFAAVTNRDHYRYRIEPEGRDFLVYSNDPWIPGSKIDGIAAIASFQMIGPSLYLVQLVQPDTGMGQAVAYEVVQFEAGTAVRHEPVCDNGVTSATSAVMDADGCSFSHYHEVYSEISRRVQEYGLGSDKFEPVGEYR